MKLTFATILLLLALIGCEKESFDYDKFNGTWVNDTNYEQLDIIVGDQTTIMLRIDQREVTQLSISFSDGNIHYYGKKQQDIYDFVISLDGDDIHAEGHLNEKIYYRTFKKLN